MFILPDNLSHLAEANMSLGRSGPFLCAHGENQPTHVSSLFMASLWTRGLGKASEQHYLLEVSTWSLLICMAGGFLTLRKP